MADFVKSVYCKLTVEWYPDDDGEVGTIESAEYTGHEMGFAIGMCATRVVCRPLAKLAEAIIAVSEWSDVERGREEKSLVDAASRLIGAWEVRDGKMAEGVN